MFDFFKKNDWKPIWFKSSYWIDDSWGKNYVRHIPVSYVILFSKVRNSYKLECHGHKPKLHEMYSEAIQELNKVDGK